MGEAFGHEGDDLVRIFEKLGISTRVELVLQAMNHGDPARLNGWWVPAGSCPRPDNPIATSGS